MPVELKTDFSDLNSLERRLNPKSTMDRVEAAVAEAAEKGKEVMREAIETRGTGKTWKSSWFGRTGSFPGRVDSGDMLRDVEGEVLTRTATTVTGVVGWADNDPMYYALQEGGFRHVLTGEMVEGMMALRDGAEVAKNSLVRGMEDIARDI